ncbi:hypothetical protein RRG08_055247 [Elysia crispata]|uniref:Uncharacterized protein n=1 Tax=Elysia crispata TaxID=231223 RepID=A0AAE0XUR6_9GAST|nr:hypothetical protein RRG08_055247 [Elysia crispata]
MRLEPLTVSPKATNLSLGAANKNQQYKSVSQDWLVCFFPGLRSEHYHVPSPCLNQTPRFEGGACGVTEGGGEEEEEGHTYGTSEDDIRKQKPVPRPSLQGHGNDAEEKR